MCLRLREPAEFRVPHPEAGPEAGAIPVRNPEPESRIPNKMGGSSFSSPFGPLRESLDSVPHSPLGSSKKTVFLLKPPQWYRRSLDDALAKNEVCSAVTAMEAEGFVRRMAWIQVTGWSLCGYLS